MSQQIITRMTVGSGKIRNFYRKLIGHLQAYRQISLTEFDNHFEHRLMLYLAKGLMVGVATFLSLYAYGVVKGKDVWLGFQGMYTWHTSLNFTLCFILVVELYRLWRRRNIRNEQCADWSLTELWRVGFFCFFIAFIIQRTLVYSLVDWYNPALIVFYEDHPGTRPTFLKMFFWSLLFWVPLYWLLLLLALWQEGRKKENQEVQAGQEPSLTLKDRWVLEGGRQTLIKSRISHLSMEDHYARIHIVVEGGVEQSLVRVSMKDAEKALDASHFIRIHRSHLVNLEHVDKIQREGKRWVVSIGGESLPISRNRLPEVKKKLSSLS